jgi:hypothetical protein
MQFLLWKVVILDDDVVVSRLRWMGPKRYDVAGVKTFLRSKSYSGTLQFRGQCRNLSTRNPSYKQFHTLPPPTLANLQFRAPIPLSSLAIGEVVLIKMGNGHDSSSDLDGKLQVPVG